MPAEISISLHPVNFIIISGIIQSVVLGAILIFRRKGKRIGNICIGLVILICSLHFSWPMIIDTNVADIFRWSMHFPYSFLLALGPLLLFYSRSLATHEFKISIKDLIHFIPVALEVTVQVLLIIQSRMNDELFYVGYGFFLFRIVELSGTAVSIFFYGKQSLAVIEQHEAWLIENFSNKKDITLFWLYQLIKYFRILLASWLVFEMSFLIFQQFQLHFIPVYLVLYVLLGIMIYSCYWIAVQALIRSEVLVDKRTEQTLTEQSSTYSKLSDSVIQKHAESIDRLMQDDRLYLEETLSLRTLALRLKLDPNLVSFVLNTAVKKSFYDYVNEFRVREVKRKINDPAFAHIKVAEIAFGSGFNSKATFNRVFKKVTGKSPTEYRDANL